MYYTIELKMLTKLLSLECIFMATLIAAVSSANFYQDMDVLFGDVRVKIDNGGQLLSLSLDNISGSGVETKSHYLFGRFDLQIKLISGYSAGTVTTFYLSSLGDNHDEIDFEFLGNATDEPYTIHTNVYAQGKGNKEQQFKLWFDPTTDFHVYSIVWNPERIIYFIDNIPFRVFNNSESIGTPFPKDQPMKMYCTLWNADDWATQGGRLKTDWTLAPFTASYQNLTINANDCAAQCGNVSSNPLNQQDWTNQDLDENGKTTLNRIQSENMIYNYCKDTNRFPQGLPAECAK